jgi:NifU-like protein involved in Fe-S cluster formation
MDGAQSKRGCAKNAMCTFCDSSFTGCSTSQAFAHLLGRAVLGKKIANIELCVLIHKEDDNIQFKSAQKVLNKDMMAEEQQLSTLQRMQTVLDLTSPAKRLLTE